MNKIIYKGDKIYNPASKRYNKNTTANIKKVQNFLNKFIKEKNEKQNAISQKQKTNDNKIKLLNQLKNKIIKEDNQKIKAINNQIKLLTQLKVNNSNKSHTQRIKDKKDERKMNKIIKEENQKIKAINNKIKLLTQLKVNNSNKSHTQRIKDKKDERKMKEQIREQDLKNNKENFINSYKESNSKYSYTYKIQAFKLVDEDSEIYKKYLEINEARIENGLYKLKNFVKYKNQYYFRTCYVANIRLNQIAEKMFYLRTLKKIDGVIVGVIDLPFLNNIIESNLTTGAIKKTIEKLISSVGSGCEGIVLETQRRIKNVKNAININHQEMNNIEYFDSHQHSTITNEYVINRVNPNSTGAGDLFLDYVNITLTRNKTACGVLIILHTLSEIWNNFYKKEEFKLTFERILNDFDDLCIKYNLTYTKTDNTVGVSVVLLGYWFMEIAKIKFQVIDIDGVKIYPLEEEHIKGFENMKENKNLGVRGVYCLFSNKHYYLISDLVDKIKSKIIINKHKGIYKPSDKCMVMDSQNRLKYKYEQKLKKNPDLTYNEFLENEKKKITETKVINEVYEIYNIIKEANEKEQDMIVYYIESIDDIIEFFYLTINHKPVVIGDILKPYGCYIKFMSGDNEFKITFLTLEGIHKDDPLYNITAEQMKKYNEIKDNVENKLLVSKNISNYSDDLKHAIGQMPSPLYMNLEKSYNPELNGIDMNKCYAYNLSSLPCFGKYYIFDEYEPYCGEEIQECSIYVCKYNSGKIRTIEDKIISFITKSGNKQNENPCDFFTTYGFCINFLLKEKLTNDFTIIKFITPYEVIENPLSSTARGGEDDIKNIYQYIGMVDKALIKNIPNIIVGKCFKRKSCNKKVYLSTCQKELHYIRNEKSKIDSNGQIENFTPILPIGSGNIFYTTEYKENKLDDGFNIISTMIYCYTRIRLLKKYCEMKKRGIKVYEIKVDSLKFNYDELNEEQKQYIHKIDKPDKWGGFKLEGLKKTFAFSCNAFLSGNNDIIQIADEDIMDEEVIDLINNKIYVISKRLNDDGVLQTVHIYNEDTPLQEIKFLNHS